MKPEKSSPPLSIRVHRVRSQINEGQAMFCYVKITAHNAQDRDTLTVSRS